MIGLDEVKVHLRLEPDWSEEDALLTSLVNAAINVLEHQTGRTFNQGTRELSLDDWAEKITLPWWPVTQVESITYRGMDGQQQTLPVQDYMLDQRLYPARIRVDQQPQTDDGHLPITVAVSVGEGSLPEDLKRAGLLLIGHLYEHREAVTVGVSGGVQELPMAVEYLVQPWRLMRIA